MIVQNYPGVPMEVVIVDGDGGSGGDGNGTGTEIKLLTAGAAAGSVQYPTTAVLQEKSILINFGSSNDATTGQFNTFLLDLNDKKSVLPGIRSNISIAQVTSANVGDVVDYTIPAGCKLRIEYTAPTGGGTLSIKGVV